MQDTAGRRERVRVRELGLAVDKDVVHLQEVALEKHRQRAHVSRHCVLRARAGASTHTGNNQDNKVEIDRTYVVSRGRAITDTEPVIVNLRQQAHDVWARSW